MPVAKSSTRKTTPRKTRTRKSSPKATKSTAQVDKVIKEIQEVLDTPTKKVVSLNKSQPLPVIVTEETKVDEKVNTPQLNRPEEPNISLDEYVADVKVRWQIHSYETKILWNQSKNLYTQTLKPALDKGVVYVKDSYNKAFNTDK